MSSLTTSPLDQTIACTMILCEVLVLVAMMLPSTSFNQSVLQTMCIPPTRPDEGALMSLHYSFMAGVALMMTATCVRVWCYRTLNAMFTFELTIQPEHSLVTHGPYSYARHPSYTAAVLNMLAFLIVHFAYGSWQRECQASSQVWYTLLMAVYVLDVAYTVVCLWQRGPVEDAKLRAHFGVRWEEYGKRVPYMYIPLVY